PLRRQGRRASPRSPAAGHEHRQLRGHLGGHGSVHLSRLGAARLELGAARDRPHDGRREARPHALVPIHELKSRSGSAPRRNPMLLRPASKSTWMRIRLFSLVLGALSLRFAVRLPGMNENRADAVSGFFYGVAIASLLLSLRAKRPAR